MTVKTDCKSLLLVELNELHGKIEILNDRKIETKDEKEYVIFMNELLQDNIKKIRERIVKELIVKEDPNKKIKFISVR